MEFIDNIYIINLEKRKDRWKECQEEIHKNNLPLNKIIKFNGIIYDGDINEGIFIPNRKSKKVDLRYCKSAYGCKKSHLNILEKHKDDKDKNILILEDDFKLCDNFNNKFNNIINDLKNIENYKICHIGYSYNKNISKYKNITSNLGIIQNVYGAQGYIINSNFINELLKFCNDCKFEIDVCYSKIQKLNNIYSSNEIIITQRSSFSNILNRKIDYSILYNK